MLLNVNNNAKTVIECELHAIVRFLALMNASSRYWSSFTQMTAYFLEMNSNRCSWFFLTRSFCFFKWLMFFNCIRFDRHLGVLI